MGLGLKVRVVAAQQVPFTIDADFDLGEAAAPYSRAHGADVVVRRGVVPLSLPRPEQRGVAWQYAAGRTLILTPCGVRFLVEGGSTMRYALDGGASLADLRLFFLGTALSVLAAQRGLLPLKASAVANGEDVHALVGGRAGWHQRHRECDVQRPLPRPAVVRFWAQEAKREVLAAHGATMARFGYSC